LSYEGLSGWAAEGEGATYWLEPAPGTPLPAGLLVIDADGAPFVTEQSRVQGAISARLALNAAGTMAAVPGGAGVSGVWFYPLASLGQVPAFMPGTRTYNSLAYGMDGALLLLGASDGWFELRDTATQRIRWEDLGHNADVNAAAYAPNGSTLATAGPRVVKAINVPPDNTILLWDTGALAMKAALAGHTGPVNALAFSPDSTLLASASDDTTVILWNAASGAEIARLEGHDVPLRAVAFSPDGALIASADTAGTVIIWDAQTREPVRTLESGVQVNAVAFSPDSALLATGGGTTTTSPDYAIRLWDVTSGEELAQLSGHTAPVGALAFNAAGTVLVSAGEDFSLRFWGLTAAG
jgi:WD40 repeat protein